MVLEALSAIWRALLPPRPTSSTHFPGVPTDDILTPFFFDDTPLYHNSAECWVLRFNDVLNADKLHAALIRLLEMDGWRKLGGRFRLNDHNRLEIHIPQAFTKERPAVNYSHVAFDLNIDEHPAGPAYQDIGQHTKSFKVSRGPILELGFPTSIPACLNDYLNSDSPQLSLHVVSFADATLVGLCWLHVTADATAVVDIGNAWSLVLAGREAEIPPMLSFREDPMRMAGCDPKFQETHYQEGRLLKKRWFKIWGVRYLTDLWLWPKMEPMCLFISSEVVQKLGQEAIASIPAQKDGSKPFISEGDVLSAWFAFLSASVLTATPQRTVVINNALDLRRRAPSLFPEPGKAAYIQNAILPCSALVPAKALFSDPMALGPAALAVRRSIESQAQEGQIHALARLFRQTLADYGLPPIFGDTSTFFVTLSNWSRTRLFDRVDFGPAVLTQASGNHPVESKPVFHNVEAVAHGKNSFGRNSFSFAKTPSGGYIVGGNLPPGIWDKAWDTISRMEADEQRST